MKKVSIVGKGSGWWDAPEEGEVWGVNDLCLVREGLTLTFELHDIGERFDPAIYEKGTIKAFEEQIEKINRLNIPTMIQKKHGAFPNGIVFPLDKMPFRYFTSSIAYMIAYAIYKKVDSIDIYGVPLYGGGEHEAQRPCLEFWIGYAMGKGIEVTIHKPSCLLSSVPSYGIYAYDWKFA